MIHAPLIICQMMGPVDDKLQRPVAIRGPGVSMAALWTAITTGPLPVSARMAG